MGCEPQIPRKVVKEKQKSKKSSPFKSFIGMDLKALDANWSERFSQLEAVLVAKTLEEVAEPTFQTVKVTSTKKPSAGAVDTGGPFLTMTNPTDQTSTNQAPVQE